MKAYFALPLAGALAALALPAAAQTGNPAGVAPDTRMSAPGKPAPSQPNYQDQVFLHQMHQGGSAEVALGRLADSKADSDRIRELARHLVQDHDKVNNRVADLAGKMKTDLPKELDRERQAVADRLDRLSGADFDRAWLEAQTQEHQKAAQLLVWEIGSGQDADLQAFARETLPIIYQHLEMIAQVAGQATGQVAELREERQEPPPSPPPASAAAAIAPCRPGGGPLN
ncbi:MAG: DUF4142 domain-containing protein [Magnetospirillum sp.]|nr:DUF4142 domain-containing protein [Magnetospirillum sp.]